MSDKPYFAKFGGDEADVRASPAEGEVTTSGGDKSGHGVHHDDSASSRLSGSDAPPAHPSQPATGEAELLRRVEAVLLTMPSSYGRWNFDAVCALKDCRASIESLARERDEMKRERQARNKIDPVTRMHNLCDALAEHRNESPYNAEALDLADESYRKLCTENASLRAKLDDAFNVLVSLEQAYSNKHSPQHRAARLSEARAVIDRRQSAQAAEGGKT